MGSNKTDIGAVFDEGTAVDEAMRQGWYRAVRRHRRLGIPLIMSRDGAIVRLDPHTVDIPEEEDREDRADPDTYARSAF